MKSSRTPIGQPPRHPEAPPPTLSDTHPEVGRILIEAYRKMSPEEKFEKIMAMQQSAWALSLADVRARYPDATPHEQQMRVAARWLGADLMRKAFSWDPDEKGY